MKTLYWLPLAAAALGAGTAHAQRLLVPGEITRGTLGSGDPVSERGAYYDEYTLHGRRGETVILQLESTAFDAYLHLGTRRGTWRQLAYDDDGGSGRNSRIEFVLPDDGTYVVRASSLRRSTGAYTLLLSGGGRGGGGWDEPPVDPVRPGPGRRDGYVRAGDRVEGYLSTADPRLDGGEPFHLYTYAGRRNERVTLTLRSADFDSYLVLGTAGGRHGVGNVLARNDDGAGNRDARIEFTLPEDRDYVIRVNPLGGGNGAYFLEVESSLQGAYSGRPGQGRRRDDAYDDGEFRDGRIDRRLAGRWGLTLPGVRVDYDDWASVSDNAAMGILTIQPTGAYTWRRDGRLLRGQLLEFTPRRGADPRSRYFVINDGRDEYYVFYTEYRGERIMQVNRRSTNEVVAYGSRDPSFP